MIDCSLIMNSKQSTRPYQTPLQKTKNANVTPKNNRSKKFVFRIWYNGDMKQEEIEIVKNFREANCRSHCEEKGQCYDCFIDYEQVIAVEHLFNAWKKERDKKRRALKYIDKHARYIGDGDYMWHLENWEVSELRKILLGKK